MNSRPPISEMKAPTQLDRIEAMLGKLIDDKHLRASIDPVSGDLIVWDNEKIIIQSKGPFKPQAQATSVSEWVPEPRVGEWVTRGHAIGDWPKGNIVKIVRVVDGSIIVIVDGQEEYWSTLGGYGKWSRRATQEEIEAYENKQKWADLDVLKEWDACECTPEQKEELLSMAKAAGVLDNDCPGDPLVYAQGYPNVLIEHSSIVNECVSRGVPNSVRRWIPFEFFKPALERTIAKMVEEKREEKVGKLKFLTPVQFKGGSKGYFHCIDNGWYKFIFENGSSAEIMSLDQIEIL